MNQGQLKAFLRPTNQARILGIIVSLLFLFLGVLLLFFDIPSIELSETKSIPAGFGVMIIGFVAGAVIGNFPIIREIRNILNSKAGIQNAAPQYELTKEKRSKYR